MSDLDTNISATALKALSVLDFVGEQRRPVTVADVADVVAGLLNARADLGQTGFMSQIGLVQENSTLLSNPPEIAQGAVTTSLPYRVPSISLEKSVDLTGICLG